jgi:hypothetical protein
MEQLGQIQWSSSDGCNDIGRTAKEAERVVITEDAYVVGPRGFAYGKAAVVVNVAVKEGPGQSDAFECSGVMR